MAEETKGSTGELHVIPPIIPKLGRSLPDLVRDLGMADKPHTAQQEQGNHRPDKDRGTSASNSTPTRSNEYDAQFANALEVVERFVSKKHSVVTDNNTQYNNTSTTNNDNENQIDVEQALRNMAIVLKRPRPLLVAQRRTLARALGGVLAQHREMEQRVRESSNAQTNYNSTITQLLTNTEEQRAEIRQLEADAEELRDQLQHASQSWTAALANEEQASLAAHEQHVMAERTQHELQRIIDELSQQSAYDRDEANRHEMYLESELKRLRAQTKHSFDVATCQIEELESSLLVAQREVRETQRALEEQTRQTAQQTKRSRELDDSRREALVSTQRLARLLEQTRDALCQERRKTDIMQHAARTMRDASEAAKASREAEYKTDTVAQDEACSDNDTSSQSSVSSSPSFCRDSYELAAVREDQTDRTRNSRQNLISSERLQRVSCSGTETAEYPVSDIGDIIATIPEEQTHKQLNDSGCMLDIKNEMSSKSMSRKRRASDSAVSMGHRRSSRSNRNNSNTNLATTHLSSISKIPLQSDDGQEYQREQRRGRQRSRRNSSRSNMSNGVQHVRMESGGGNENEQPLKFPENIEKQDEEEKVSKHTVAVVVSNRVIDECDVFAELRDPSNHMSHLSVFADRLTRLHQGGHAEAERASSYSLALHHTYDNLQSLNRQLEETASELAEKTTQVDHLEMILEQTKSACTFNEANLRAQLDVARTDCHLALSSHQELKRMLSRQGAAAIVRAANVFKMRAVTRSFVRWKQRNRRQADATRGLTGLKRIFERHALRFGLLNLRDATHKTLSDEVAKARVAMVNLVIKRRMCSRAFDVLKRALHVEALLNLQRCAGADMMLSRSRFKRLTHNFRQWTQTIQARGKARHAVASLTRIQKRQELSIIKVRFNQWLRKFENVSVRFELAVQKLNVCLTARRTLRFALMHWQSSTNISHAQQTSVLGRRLAACTILCRVGSNFDTEAMRAPFGILWRHSTRMAQHEYALRLLASRMEQRESKQVWRAWGCFKEEVVSGRAQDQLQVLLGRMHDTRVINAEQQMCDRGRVVAGLLECKRIKMVARAWTVLRVKQHEHAVQKVCAVRQTNALNFQSRMHRATVLALLLKTRASAAQRWMQAHSLRKLSNNVKLKMRQERALESLRGMMENKQRTVLTAAIQTWNIQTRACTRKQSAVMLMTAWMTSAAEGGSPLARRGRVIVAFQRWNIRTIQDRVKEADTRNRAVKLMHARLHAWMRGKLLRSLARWRFAAVSRTKQMKQSKLTETLDVVQSQHGRVCANAREKAARMLVVWSTRKAEMKLTRAMSKWHDVVEERKLRVKKFVECLHGRAQFVQLRSTVRAFGEWRKIVTHAQSRENSARMKKGIAGFIDKHQRRRLLTKIIHGWRSEIVFIQMRKARVEELSGCQQIMIQLRAALTDEKEAAAASNAALLKRQQESKTAAAKLVWQLCTRASQRRLTQAMRAWQAQSTGGRFGEWFAISRLDSAKNKIDLSIESLRGAMLRWRATVVDMKSREVAQTIDVKGLEVEELRTQLEASVDLMYQERKERESDELTQSDALQEQQQRVLHLSEQLKEEQDRVQAGVDRVEQELKRGHMVRDAQNKALRATRLRGLCIALMNGEKVVALRWGWRAFGRLREAVAFEHGVEHAGKAMQDAQMGWASPFAGPFFGSSQPGQSGDNDDDEEEEDALDDDSIGRVGDSPQRFGLQRRDDDDHDSAGRYGGNIGRSSGNYSGFRNRSSGRSESHGDGGNAGRRGGGYRGTNSNRRQMHTQTHGQRVRMSRTQPRGTTAASHTGRHGYSRGFEEHVSRDGDGGGGGGGGVGGGYSTDGGWGGSFGDSNNQSIYPFGGEGGSDGQQLIDSPQYRHNSLTNSGHNNDDGDNNSVGRRMHESEGGGRLHNTSSLRHVPSSPPFSPMSMHAQQQQQQTYSPPFSRRSVGSRAPRQLEGLYNEEQEHHAFFRSKRYAFSRSSRYADEQAAQEQEQQIQQQKQQQQANQQHQQLAQQQQQMAQQQQQQQQHQLRYLQQQEQYQEHQLAAWQQEQHKQHQQQQEQQEKETQPQPQQLAPQEQPQRLQQQERYQEQQLNPHHEKQHHHRQYQQSQPQQHHEQQQEQQQRTGDVAGHFQDEAHDIVQVLSSEYGEQQQLKFGEQRETGEEGRRMGRFEAEIESNEQHQSTTIAIRTSEGLVYPSLVSPSSFVRPKPRAIPRPLPFHLALHGSSNDSEGVAVEQQRREYAVPAATTTTNSNDDDDDDSSHAEVVSIPNHEEVLHNSIVQFEGHRLKQQRQQHHQLQQRDTSTHHQLQWTRSTVVHKPKQSVVHRALLMPQSHTTVAVADWVGQQEQEQQQQLHSEIVSDALREEEEEEEERETELRSVVPNYTDPMSVVNEQGSQQRIPHVDVNAGAGRTGQQQQQQQNSPHRLHGESPVCGIRGHLGTSMPKQSEEHAWDTPVQIESPLTPLNTLHPDIGLIDVEMEVQMVKAEAQISHHHTTNSTAAPTHTSESFLSSTNSATSPIRCGVNTSTSELPMHRVAAAVATITSTDTSTDTSPTNRFVIDSSTSPIHRIVVVNNIDSSTSPICRAVQINATTSNSPVHQIAVPNTTTCTSPIHHSALVNTGTSTSPSQRVSMADSATSTSPINHVVVVNNIDSSTSPIHRSAPVNTGTSTSPVHHATMTSTSTSPVHRVAVVFDNIDSNTSPIRRSAPVSTETSTSPIHHATMTSTSTSPVHQVLVHSMNSSTSPIHRSSPINTVASTSPVHHAVTNTTTSTSPVYSTVASTSPIHHVLPINATTSTSSMSVTVPTVDSGRMSLSKSLSLDIPETNAKAWHTNHTQDDDVDNHTSIDNNNNNKDDNNYNNSNSNNHGRHHGWIPEQLSRGVNVMSHSFDSSSEGGGDGSVSDGDDAGGAGVRIATSQSSPLSSSTQSSLDYAWSVAPSPSPSPKRQTKRHSARQEGDDDDDDDEQQQQQHDERQQQQQQQQQHQHYEKQHHDEQQQQQHHEQQQNERKQNEQQQRRDEQQQRQQQQQHHVQQQQYYEQQRQQHEQQQQQHDQQRRNMQQQRHQHQYQQKRNEQQQRRKHHHQQHQYGGNTEEYVSLYQDENGENDDDDDDESTRYVNNETQNMQYERGIPDDEELFITEQGEVIQIVHDNFIEEEGEGANEHYKMEPHHFKMAPRKDSSEMINEHQRDMLAVEKQTGSATANPLTINKNISQQQAGTLADVRLQVQAASALTTQVWENNDDLLFGLGESGLGFEFKSQSDSVLNNSSESRWSTDVAATITRNNNNSDNINNSDNDKDSYNGHSTNSSQWPGLGLGNFSSSGTASTAELVTVRRRVRVTSPAISANVPGNATPGSTRTSPTTVRLTRHRRDTSRNGAVVTTATTVSTAIATDSNISVPAANETDAIAMAPVGGATGDDDVGVSDVDGVGNATPRNIDTNSNPVEIDVEIGDHDVDVNDVGGEGEGEGAIQISKGSIGQSRSQSGVHSGVGVDRMYGVDSRYFDKFDNVAPTTSISSSTNDLRTHTGTTFDHEHTHDEHAHKHNREHVEQSKQEDNQFNTSKTPLNMTYNTDYDSDERRMRISNADTEARLSLTERALTQTRNELARSRDFQTRLIHVELEAEIDKEEILVNQLTRSRLAASASLLRTQLRVRDSEWQHSQRNGDVGRDNEGKGGLMALDNIVSLSSSGASLSWQRMSGGSASSRGSTKRKGGQRAGFNVNERSHNESGSVGRMHNSLNSVSTGARMTMTSEGGKSSGSNRGSPLRLSSLSETKPNQHYYTQDRFRYFD